MRTGICAVLALIGSVVGSACSNRSSLAPPTFARTTPALGAIDESILPDLFRTAWDPGIPGGIPADDDPVRPASVWLPPGDPYNGYSVDPALAGRANAAAFTAAFQAAINSAGQEATPTSRKIVFLSGGTYFVNPQRYPGSGSDQVGIYVKVDNVTIRGSGADTTRLAANGTINNYGTVVLFGHRVGHSDADFAVRNVIADASRGDTTIQVADASAYVVGDVITIDHLDGVPVPEGPATLNSGYLWYYDGQYFKRQPTYDWNGPSTGAPNIPRGADCCSTVVLDDAGNRDHRYQRQRPNHQGPALHRLPARLEPAGLAHRAAQYRLDSGGESLVRARKHRGRWGQQPVGLPRRLGRVQLHGLLLGEEHRGRRREMDQPARPCASWQVRIQHRPWAQLSVCDPRFLRSWLDGRKSRWASLRASRRSGLLGMPAREQHLGQQQ